MTGSYGETPNFDGPQASEILLSMYSDALGYDVTERSELTPEEALTADRGVQARLDAAAEQMRDMEAGRQVDLDAMDTKAQAALLIFWAEQRES